MGAQDKPCCACSLANQIGDFCRKRSFSVSAWDPAPHNANWSGCRKRRYLSELWKDDKRIFKQILAIRYLKNSEDWCESRSV